MRKLILFGGLILSTFLGFGQDLMNKNFEGFRVKVSELMINKDSMKSENPDSGMVMKYDGNKWAKGTERYILDSAEVLHLKDTLDIVATKNLVGDTAQIVHRGDSTEFLIPLIELHSIETDPFYTLDSLFLNRTARDYVSDSLKLVHWADTLPTSGAGIATKFDHSQTWLKGGQAIGANKVLGSTDNYDIGFITNNTERVTLKNNGLLNPLFNVRLENTTHAAEVGIIYKGTTPFIHDFNYGNNGTVTTDGNNFFAGGAGNLTMGATATSKGQSSYNIGIGYQAIYSTTIGGYNIGIGWTSGRLLTTGNYNVLIGAPCASALTTGNNNTLIGSSSGGKVTTGYDNTFIGAQSGYFATGYGNVTIGKEAGYGAINSFAGIYNVLIGNTSGYSISTGGRNTAVGYQSLYSNTIGSYNTAVGYRALYSNTTQSNSTAIGGQALYSNTTGVNNVAIGFKALYANITTSNNTVIGNEAGAYIANGSTALTITTQSVFLGANTKAKQDNSTNEIVIGYNTTGNGSNTGTWGNTSMTNHYFTGKINADKLKITQITAALTDNTPTDAEIDTATSLTPSTAGAGWQCTIKDNDGSGLIYKIESDGTDWYYIALTKAL